jgi:hypothetical protein
MTFADATHWVEKHPTEAIIIGGASVIALLWLLGAFSGGSKGDAGASNLASAYYAAEAQQAVVGGQIQQANIMATAATAQKTLDDNAAIAINAAQTHAAVRINGQNADAAQTINGQNVDAAQTINAQNVAYATAYASDQLQATYSNNSALVQTNAANNATAQAVNAANNQTSLMHDYVTAVLPQELAQYGGSGFSTNLTGSGFLTSVLTNPNLAKGAGFTARGAEQAFGWPAGSVAG